MKTYRQINTLWGTLIASALLASAVQAQSGDGLNIGDRIPMADRKMSSVKDETFSISDVKGESGTVVFFWCNTCPWVKKYEGRMVEIATTYIDQGFGFIAVNSNDPVAYPGDSMEEMKKQAAENDYPFEYVADAGSELAVAFGAQRTPQVYVFDSDDSLVYAGAPDDSPSDPSKVEDAFLADALDAVAAGSAVPIAETKSFGCTIKFQ